jgi:hypothetical protein
MRFTYQAVYQIVRSQISSNRNLAMSTVDRRAAAKFGCSTGLVHKLWHELLFSGNLPDGGTIFQLLYTLEHLKCYGTYNKSATDNKVAENTYIKWIWLFIEAIAKMKHIVSSVLYFLYFAFFPVLTFITYYLYLYIQVVFKNRLMQENGSTCLMTLDGTDCRIYEPAPFNKKWFSHKFKGPALRYEVGVCIQTGYIVWKNGPYPAGTWPDLKIARHKVLKKLRLNEKVLADGGYNDQRTYCETPTGHNNSDQRMKQVARARHETINRRLKQFTILSQVYRNDRKKHMFVFHAICNIVQLDITIGNAPFEVQYYDGIGTPRELFPEELERNTYNPTDLEIEEEQAGEDFTTTVLTRY